MRGRSAHPQSGNRWRNDRTTCSRSVFMNSSRQEGFIDYNGRSRFTARCSTRCCASKPRYQRMDADAFPAARNGNAAGPSPFRPAAIIDGLPGARSAG